MIAYYALCWHLNYLGFPDEDRERNVDDGGDGGGDIDGNNQGDVDSGMHIKQVSVCVVGVWECKL